MSDQLRRIVIVTARVNRDIDGTYSGTIENIKNTRVFHGGDTRMGLEKQFDKVLADYLTIDDPNPDRDVSRIYLPRYYTSEGLLL